MPNLAPRAEEGEGEGEASSASSRRDFAGSGPKTGTSAVGTPMTGVSPGRLPRKSDLPGRGASCGRTLDPRTRRPGLRDHRRCSLCSCLRLRRPFPSTLHHRCHPSSTLPTCTGPWRFLLISREVVDAVSHGAHTVGPAGLSRVGPWRAQTLMTDHSGERRRDRPVGRHNCRSTPGPRSLARSARSPVSAPSAAFAPRDPAGTLPGCLLRRSGRQGVGPLRGLGLDGGNRVGRRAGS